MEHKADFLWDNMMKVFGNDFFLPKIGRDYGHLFVNDIEKHQSEVLNAISGAKKTEMELMKQMTDQVNGLKEQLGLAEAEVLRQKQKIYFETEKARKKGIAEG